MPMIDLPNIGNGIDYRPFWERENFKKHRKDLEQLRQNLELAERIFGKRNINPEFTRLMGQIPAFRKAVKDKRLDFMVEIPGLNSDRAYMGLKYRF